MCWGVRPENRLWESVAGDWERLEKGEMATGGSLCRMVIFVAVDIVSLCFYWFGIYFVASVILVVILIIVLISSSNYLSQIITMHRTKYLKVSLEYKELFCSTFTAGHEEHGRLGTLQCFTLWSQKDSARGSFILIQSISNLQCEDHLQKLSRYFSKQWMFLWY